MATFIDTESFVQHMELDLVTGKLLIDDGNALRLTDD
jgi:hypothetical protein